MYKQTVLVDGISEMVHICAGPLGWAWFRFDELKRNLHFWQDRPAFRMSDVRRKAI